MDDMDDGEPGVFCVPASISVEEYIKRVHASLMLRVLLLPYQQEGNC